MRKNEERLDLYRRSLARAWGYTDYNDWPVKLNAAFHLFLAEFGDDLLDDLDHLLRERALTYSEVAALFRNPARIYRMIDSAIYSMRRRGLKLTAQRERVIELLDLVAAMKHGSEFNEDGRNIIHDPPTVALLAAMITPVCCRADSALVHRLCGIAWAYTETMFFRAHDVTKEIHGPYELPDGAGELIVKEYLNMCPVDLWPRARLLEHDEIRVLQWYRMGVRVEIDALNHLYHRGRSSMIDQLVGYRVEVDGRPVETPEIEDLITRLADAVAAQTACVDGLSWHEKVEKYAEIFWFRKSPLRRARGLSWELGSRLREQIRAGHPNPKRVLRMTEKEVHRLALLTI